MNKKAITYKALVAEALKIFPVTKLFFRPELVKFDEAQSLFLADINRHPELAIGGKIDVTQTPQWLLPLESFYQTGLMLALGCGPDAYIGAFLNFAVNTLNRMFASEMSFAPWSLNRQHFLSPSPQL